MHQLTAQDSNDSFTCNAGAPPTLLRRHAVVAIYGVVILFDLLLVRAFVFIQGSTTLICSGVDDPICDLHGWHAREIASPVLTDLIPKVIITHDLLTLYDARNRHFTCECAVNCS